MKIQKKPQFIIGIIITLLSCSLIIFLFISVYVKQQSNMGYSFIASEAEDYDWSYEIKSGSEVFDTEPIFSDYDITFPAEAIDAIKCTRILTEDVPDGKLTFEDFYLGIEVYLDDKLLFCDLEADSRDENGYLIPENPEEEAAYHFTCISLPEDGYTGKALTIITYFSQGDTCCYPAYPLLENDIQSVAPAVISTILPSAVLTICGAFAIILCVIFIMDSFNQNSDYRSIFLIVFFLMLFVINLLNSFIGVYSGINHDALLNFLNKTYIIPVIIFLALFMSGWRRLILLVLSGLIFIYALLCSLYKVDFNMQSGLNNINFLELILLLVSLAIFILEAVKIKKSGAGIPVRRYLRLLAISFIICCIYFSAEWDGNVFIYFSTLWISTVKYRVFAPLVNLFSMMLALTAVMSLIESFIKRTIKSRQSVVILEERNHLTMENYRSLLKAENATREMRHEMKHHMTALLGFLNNDDSERAKEYILSIDKNLGELPPMAYSKNLIINTIVGTCIARARKNNIKTSCTINVPEKLGITDDDLCILLTNMLENAIEACCQLDASARFIELTIQKEGNFLFVGCKNSAKTHPASSSGDFPTSKPDKEMHGYGIPAMKKVADKYNSILKLSPGGDTFSIMTNLQLKEV